ncbi:MAG: 3-methyladenine DNA glycosylase [Mycobacterium sp.]
MSDACVVDTRVLAESEWSVRAAAHRARVEKFIAPQEERTRAGIQHPVWDFLFTYYNLKPRQLKRWHPGYGVRLAGAAAHDYLHRSGYAQFEDGVGVTGAYLAGRANTVAFILRLLSATAARPAQLNCFGMHEWAMVYRAGSQRRHEVPLRLGAAGTDAAVESIPLRCSHFDAFRFFTADAAPMNSGTPTRDTQVNLEQPGCIHAAMDLYKWAGKLGPLVDSELLASCLVLAAAAREVDMQASPYDLRVLGYSPIAVETGAGRAEYVRRQSEIAQQAVPLRAELLSRCERLLEACGRSSGQVTDG